MRAHERAFVRGVRVEGDGAAALRAFGERKADTKRTASRDDARTLNLASVFELSGASATASRPRAA